MMSPDATKIYHITHVRNLPQIVKTGKLWSDAKRIELGLNCEIVGMSQIKGRRLREIGVDCHPGTTVGDYVPFYFCPRSIMLYILHMGNHPDLDYREGQVPIVHLQADLRTVVKWADGKGRRWAFSDRNAGTYYASFFADLSQLSQVDWSAVGATDFRSPAVKEGKQAEFLVYESFPWELVEKIGVIDLTVERTVNSLLTKMNLAPLARVERTWYY